MKSDFRAGGRIAPLVILALVSNGCVNQIMPGRSMSPPAIAGQTEVKTLLGAIDKDLAQPVAVTQPVAAATTGTPVRLSLQEALLTGLERNQSFTVERLKPAVSRAGEEAERAAFDPVLSGSASHAHGQATAGSSALKSAAPHLPVSDDVETTRSGVTLSQPTSLGSTLALSADSTKQAAHDVKGTELKLSSWDLTVTQALLQGRGPEVTLARLRQSRLDTEISLYELQGAAEALVAQTEQGYWDLVLAGRALAIQEQSLAIAKQQVEEVAERIKVGALAESESAAAESEAAARTQQLVAAQGALVKARLNLLRLVNPANPADWQAEIVLPDAPELPEAVLDGVENHVTLALAKRPDLNQARLQVRRRDLDVVQTKNGLLPKLDLFVSVGGSRYTEAVAGDSDTSNQRSYAGGLTLEVPLGNRAARARHAAAGWSLDQANAAMVNMEHLVQVDVRSAYVDVEQAIAQAKAAEATRLLREKTCAIEQEKFRLGRSTTLLVAQAQRDMAASQIAQADAVVAVRKAQTSLYRLEGSLLAHRGIVP